MPRPAEPPRPAPRPAPTGRPTLTWESFGASALWRLVGLLSLLVVVLGVLTWSWDVALGAARLSLVVLLVIATWLYVVWFRRQRAEPARREQSRDENLRDYRPH